MRGTVLEATGKAEPTENGHSVEENESDDVENRGAGASGGEGGIHGEEVLKGVDEGGVESRGKSEE